MQGAIQKLRNALGEGGMVIFVTFCYENLERGGGGGGGSSALMLRNNSGFFKNLISANSRKKMLHPVVQPRECTR